MISIIIPIYNQEKYIGDCLESIISQSFRDYEVILINDGSTDNSKDICKKYLEKHECFYYYEQTNQGVSVARNKGLLEAHGQWIMFVDPDDTICPNLLSELYAFVDTEVDIISCCCNVFKNDVKDVDYFYDKSCEFRNADEKKELIKQIFIPEYRHTQRTFTAIGVPWGKLYRKSFLDENCLTFDPLLRRMQDNVFNMDAFWKANTVIYLNKPLYCYRLDNICNFYKSSYKDYLFYNYSLIQKKRFEFLKESNLIQDVEIKNFFYNDAISQIIGIFNSQLFNEMNKDNLREKRRMYFSVINSEEAYYKEAIQTLKFGDLRNRKHACLLMLFKTKLFTLSWLVWCIRNIKRRFGRKNGDEGI